MEEGPLYRVLRALASVGLFDETAPREFALTEAGQLLRPGVPGSMHDVVLWITSPFDVRVEYLRRKPELSEITPGGDAYIMKHVIHEWDDDKALLILQNIRTAMGAKRGRVILLESVLPAGNAPDFSRIIDLDMMLLPGARERTADEFEALFTRAGFEVTMIVPTASPLSVIEARLV